MYYFEYPTADTTIFEGNLTSSSIGNPKTF